MKGIRFILSNLLCCMLLFALPLTADAYNTSDHGIYIGMQGELTTVDWDSSFQSTAFSNQTNQVYNNYQYGQHYLAFGFKLGYLFCNYVGLQLEYNIYRSNTWNAEIAGGGNRIIDAGQETSTDLTVLGLYPIDKINVTLYGRVGAAYQYTLLTDNNDVPGGLTLKRAHQNYLPVIGAGAVYQLPRVKGVSIYFDYMHIFGKDNVAFVGEGVNNNVLNINLPARNVYSFGISYFFAFLG